MGIRGLLSSLGGGINNLGSKMGDLQGDPMFNLGVGLLAQGQPGPGAARSFGQGLLGAMDYSANKTAQFQNLQNSRQMMKMRKDAATRAQEQFDLAKEQRQKQELAQAGLLNMMQNPASSIPASSIPASIRRPGAIQDEQRQMMMGLLMQANPEAATTGLLTSMFTPPKDLPSDVRTMQYLQQNPGMMKTYQTMKGGNQELRDMVDLMRLRQMDQDFNVTEREQNTLRRAEDATARNLIQGGLKVLESEIDYADTGGSHGPSIMGVTNLNFGGMAEAVAPGLVPGAKESGETQGTLQKNLADFRNIAAPEGSTNFALQQSAEAQASMEQLPAVNVGVVKGRLENLLFSYQNLSDAQFTEKFGVSREEVAETIQRASDRFAAQNPGASRRESRGQMGRNNLGAEVPQDDMDRFQ